MAGTNKVYKPGQVLFKSGDKSDGMYVVRQGQLQVYLEQDGKEVVLATIADGGIVGEMAFFDSKPRSASVRAVKPSDVSVISNDDFSKLLKQIPKWFVTLMQALSTRLRQTNERLQKMEGMRPVGRPYDAVVRLLHALNLIWHKDGTKEGKDWLLEATPAKKLLADMFGDDPKRIDLLIEVLAKNAIIGSAVNSYKAQMLKSNKGEIERFLAFLTAFLKANPPKPCIPDEGLQLLAALKKIADAAPYESLVVSMSDLETEGKTMQCKTESWRSLVDLINCAGDAVKSAKSSDGNAGFKAAKKDLPTLIRYHTLINELNKAGF